MVFKKGQKAWNKGLPKEVVHHINEIRDDNRLENLQLIENKGKHKKLHLKLKRTIKCEEEK